MQKSPHPDEFQALQTRYAHTLEWILKSAPEDEYTPLELSYHFLPLLFEMNFEFHKINPLHPARIQILILLTRVSIKLEQYKSGKSWIDEAIKLTSTQAYQKALPIKDRHFIQQSLLLEEGRILYFQDKFQEAYQTLKHCLTLSPSRADTIESLKLQVRIHLTFGLICTKYHQAGARVALKHYQTALTLSKSLKSEAPLFQAEAKKGLGNCLRWLGQSKAADTQYRASLKLYEKRLPTLHPSPQGVRFNRAILGFCQGFEKFDSSQFSFDTALESIEQALISFQTWYGPKSNAVVMALQWFSQARFLQGEYNEALRLRNKVIKIWKDKKGSHSLDLLYSYFWKGRILEEKAKRSPEDLQEKLIAEAKKSYQRVLAMGPKLKLDTHIAYYADHVKRARVHLRTLP